MLAQRTDQPHRQRSLSPVVMLQLSSFFLYKATPKSAGTAPLAAPEKVIEPQPFEPLLCFLAAAATRGGELFVNRRC